MTNHDFFQAAVKAGVVDEAAVEDSEGYDGGDTLHRLSMMWTIVCEQWSCAEQQPEKP